jgi:DNA-binding NarL/FixJ family response regulator
MTTNTLERLTPSEVAVVRGIASGLRLREIADERGTSVKTVKAQSGSARRKAGAHTLAHLAALWVANAPEQE